MLQNKKCELQSNGVGYSRLPKSQTSPGKAAMIFLDIVSVDGPRKGLTGFALFEFQLRTL